MSVRALACIAGTALALVAGVARADTLEVRVVTWNVWDLPFVSDARAERVERIGTAIAALRPQIVALQEAWVPGDAARIASDLAAAGLVHARRFPAGLVGSGLLVASVWPITDERFLPYSVAGKPERPWHGDWYATKGIAVVTVATPLGPLRVADTHLHAGYRPEDGYLAVQAAQAIEALDLLRDEGGDPLLLCGDLNSAPGELPFRLIVFGAGLAPAHPEVGGVDWVLARAGARVGARCRTLARALGERVELGSRRAPLSDHDARLAVVELATGAGAPSGRDPRFADAAAEARPLLADARASATLRLAVALAGSCASAALAAARPSRRARRRRLVAAVLCAACLAYAVAAAAPERRGYAAALERAGARE